MANAADNPLFKHFRQPAIYLKLPSEGAFYPEGTLDLPATGAIPVFPMTVKDELTLKTPDALLNGQGMVDVIHSCCPNIKDAWKMPAVDVDAIFIAIRLASYGAQIDINTTCPHCKEENEHGIDLRSLLDNIKPVDYTRPTFIEGLTFMFKPQTYKNINDISLINYEEQRLVDSVLQNTTMSEEEKAIRFSQSFIKLKQMNIDSISACILSIATEEGTVVTDRKQINEFLENTSREAYAEIKDRSNTLINDNKMQGLTLACIACGKEYKNGLEFDQASFFGKGFWH